MNVHASNLLIALRAAAQARGDEEARLKFDRPSAYLQGIHDLIKYIQDGGTDIHVLQSRG